MNKKIIVTLMLCVSLLSLKKVNAQEIVKDSSIEMGSIRTVTKYFKTESLVDRLTKEVLDVRETELTKDQYDRLDYMSEPQANCSDGAACWETDYKKVSLSVETPPSVISNGKLILKTTWKNVPSVKSYDIIAATFAYGMSNVSASFSANSSVASNAGNKVQANGAGISVKLNNKISAESTITLTITGKYSQLDYWTNGKICGTYQHAQSTVSSADSLAYSFSKTQGGVGGVLNFNSTTIKDKYDQMRGVCVGP